MAYLLAAPFSYFTDANGAPLNGGKIYTYAAGTTTPQASYTDYTGITPLANPVILDSAGRAQIWLVGSYKIKVTDSLDNQIGTPVDNISATAATATELNYLSGVTPGTATASKAVVLDSSKNVTGLATNTFGASSTSIANMAAVMGSLSGMLNLFHNPGCTVKQRGALGTVTSGSSAYSYDGYIVTATGATSQWNTGGALFPGSPDSLSVNSNTGLTGVTVKRRIEGSYAQRLNGIVTTIQAYIYNNTGATITPTLTIKHATALDNWGATSIDVSAVSLQPCPASTATMVCYTFTASASSGNGLEATIDYGSSLNASVNSKAVITGNWDIRPTPGVTVGLNSTPPLIELRGIQHELDFSQRYFNSTFGNGNAPAQSFGLAGALGAQDYGATAGEVFTQWNFATQMRAAPAITTYNPSAANANWRDVTGSSDVVVSVDPDSAKGTSGVLIGAQTTALTAGHRLYIHATASAEL